MSWIRSAVNRAVEVGGNNNLTRTVRSYADTVVGGGAKLFQDRNAARNFQSYKLAAKRLEEVSVSCRGDERIQLLRRWLVSLKEIVRLNETVNNGNLEISNGSYDSPPRPTVVLYYDPDLEAEPLNFRDVFLFSQALEGITLSLILELPDDEEISLLLEIFGLCLVGGREEHNIIVNYVRDLAKAFSTYDEEVLAKREELLQYAQDAIGGLKMNWNIVRIDSEVSNIHKELNVMKKGLPPSEGDKTSPEAVSSGMSQESAKEALSYMRLCSRLEELLLRKKLVKSGDSAAAHNEKIDKLKVLSESLASSTSKTEKRISDNRTQKEEALKFRVAKTSEVGDHELELAAEVEDLEKRKSELEVELKKVSTALTSTYARLRNAREEREQFGEASNQIIQHFKFKDDELSKSNALYRAEAEVCNTYINFLEKTWDFQTSYTEQNQKLVNNELERHQDVFTNWVIDILAAYKDELGTYVSSIREIVSNLKGLNNTSATEEQNDAVNSKRRLEEKYQTIETKFLTTLSVVESIKKQFYTQPDNNPRKCEEKVKHLLDTLEKIKEQFDSIERPNLEIETPTIRDETILSQSRTPILPFLSRKQPPNEKLELNLEPKPQNEVPRGLSLPLVPKISLPLVSINKPSEAETQLAKLRLELEHENHCRGDSLDGHNDWEFDENIQPTKTM